jgi:glycosyltransferase involved in cell wall biosynthesis
MTLYYSTLNTTTTVENFVDLSLFPRRTPDFSTPILLHAGRLSKERGLFNMVNTAQRISGNFSFYVAGKLEKNILIDSLKPLIYLGEIDQKEIIEIYNKSNIGIILYNNIGQFLWREL